MFQAYEGLTTFSIFDTGASVVTFGANDQFLFQLFGSGGIPIKVPCGAVAEGVGGQLVGHVSDPGTVLADGLHVAALRFDSFGFPEFDIQFDLARAASMPDVQVFVGALEGPEEEGGCTPLASADLPTITGTPILNPAPGHPNGLAVAILPQGEILDFSEFEGLQGIVIPVPDVQFQDPGLPAPEDPNCTADLGNGPQDICTDAIRINVEFVGFDNSADPGDSISESFNPVHHQVTAEHHGVRLTDQTYLIDTGAQLSIISSAAAEAFGLDLDNPQTTISVQGAAGAVHDIPGYTIDRLTIPLAGGDSLSFIDVPIYVLDVAEGVLDGILGMNLFNNVSTMLYDPHDPAGPALQLAFFTEHAIDLPDIPPGEFALLSQFLPAFAGTIGGGRLPTFDLPDPTQPTVTLEVPAAANSGAPGVTVRASNSAGDGAAVALDIDRNDDGDFDDAGEAGYTLSTLAAGQVQFAIAPALPEGRYRAQARVGIDRPVTSAVISFVVDLTAPAIAPPLDVTSLASDSGGAVVTYPLPSATDALDTEVAVICEPASGTAFQIGNTTCTAIDAAGNSQSVQFTVHVVAAGKIKGRVFEDADGDGTRDGDDTPLVGATVFLDHDRDGALDGGEPSKPTRSGGRFAFGNLVPGDYQVALVAANGFVATAQDAAAAEGEVTTGINLATYRPARITANLYYDDNRNGRRDPTELALSGWTVFLDRDGDAILDPGEAAGQTGSTGRFAFRGLRPGAYQVFQVLPEGWQQVTPASGARTTMVRSGGTARASFASDLALQTSGNAMRDAPRGWAPLDVQSLDRLLEQGAES
jgi:hypothetical protein